MAFWSCSAIGSSVSSTLCQWHHCIPESLPRSYIIKGQGKQYHRTRQHTCALNYTASNPIPRPHTYPQPVATAPIFKPKKQQPSHSSGREQQLAAFQDHKHQNIPPLFRTKNINHPHSKIRNINQPHSKTTSINTYPNSKTIHCNKHYQLTNSWHI